MQNILCYFLHMNIIDQLLEYRFGSYFLSVANIPHSFSHKEYFDKSLQNLYNSFNIHSYELIKHQNLQWTMNQWTMLFIALWKLEGPSCWEKNKKIASMLSLDFVSEILAPLKSAVDIYFILDWWLKESVMLHLDHFILVKRILTWMDRVWLSKENKMYSTTEMYQLSKKAMFSPQKLIFNFAYITFPSTL